MNDAHEIDEIYIDEIIRNNVKILSTVSEGIHD